MNDPAVNEQAVSDQALDDKVASGQSAGPGASKHAGRSGDRSFDITQILKVLPHRYPFLLVDRIIEARDDVSCIGIKNVSFNEPQFQGHFPGQPVMPGVLLIEGMAQTAGAFCIRAREKDGSGGPPPLVYFMTIDKAKFRKPVVPGDQVEYHVERTNRRRNIWWFKARGIVDGQCVCEAEFSALLSETAI